MYDELPSISANELEINRQRAREKSANIDADTIKKLRVLAKTDLFFLAHGILGYKDLSPVLHNDLCKWVERTENKQYREILLPRSHYKSTICSIADTIRLALPDDSGTLQYPHNLGPNIRILLSHETKEGAEQFLYAITQHFTSNILLMALFPELVPSAATETMNKSRLKLPRTIIASEPTFDTLGVGNKAQGRHYNYIKCDDLYGAAARDSEAERKTTIQWVDNLQSFLITPKTDHIDFIGTRWAYDDYYAHIEKQYEEQLHKYIRACEEYNEEAGKKIPIFPEKFTPESLKILKKNKTVWNAQYVNNPSEGSSEFQKEWLKYYNKANNRTLVVFDGAESRKVDIDSMDKIIFIDPATVGLGGIVITGTDKKTNIYVLEAMKKSWTPTELTEEVFKLVLKYTPRLVVIEEVLFSVVFQPWWQREMSVRNIRFKIEGAKTRQQHKPDRVKALSTYYAAGQIYVDKKFEEFIEEFEQFGATDNYHMHDAMAYGPRYWRPSVGGGQISSSDSVPQKKVDFYSY